MGDEQVLVEQTGDQNRIYAFGDSTSMLIFNIG